MRKSSRAISLTLIGSGLILAGCSGCASQPEDDGPPTTASHSSGGGHGSWGGYYGRSGRVFIGNSSGGGTGSRSANGAAVSRGGFGAAGHASGGS